MSSLYFYRVIQVFPVRRLYVGGLYIVIFQFSNKGELMIDELMIAFNS